MQFQQLNDAQIAAVTAPLKPTLVLAGAGSGKTRVLTNRIIHLVGNCGVSPSEILAITFTNKAANEMKKRLWDFDCAAQYMHVSTIHSFCATVLRREAKAVNRNGNFSIYTEEEKKSVIKKIVKNVFDDSDSKVVDGFCESISGMKNNVAKVLDADVSELSDGDMAELIAAYGRDEYLSETLERLLARTQMGKKSDLVRVIGEYGRKMAENNAMDFDDLLYYVHKLFSDFPDILAKYQDRYRYILIDEFQDTNKVQYEIFRMLAEKFGNIFVVGDDDQSIYGWRGADVRNILNFPKDFPDAQIFKLEQNYRSTKRILDAANEIISKNVNRYEKKLWTENEDGVKVQLFSAYNEQDEAYYVAEQIKNLRYISDDYSLRDCAVLMRVNALSRSFEQEFTRNRMPYKVFGGFKFFERREIKDVLAYLRLIDNPADAEAFLRAVNVPVKRGIGDTTLARLQGLSAEYGISLTEVISDERNMETLMSSARSRLSQFYTLYCELCDLAHKENVARFVHDLLDILEFRSVYVASEEEDRALNLDEFEQSVIEFQTSNPHATLSDYLQTVSLVSDADAEDDGDYVTIATIHAVKGLEFKAVFIVGLEEGLFPTSRSTYDINDFQEERRLMYVAATRAKKRLYVTRANTRFLYGQRKTTLASKFYAEIQRHVTPERAAARESDLYNDNYLDKLNLQSPSRPSSSGGKSDKEVSSFKVGQTVEHNTFGKGIILRIDKGIADVVFETAGKKSLSIKFAPMQIVSK